MEVKAKYNATVLVILAAALCLTVAAEIDCDKRPEFVNPQTCCPMPEMITDEIKEKCAEFLKPSSESADDEGQTNPAPHPRPHPHPPHHRCFLSCVFNETGIFNDEQKLDEEKLSEFLTTNLQDANEEWIPIMEASFKTCMAKVEEKIAKWQAKREEKMASSSESKNHHKPCPGCPMRAAFLSGCVFMENVQNCPASVWNDNEQCNAFRDHIKECGPPHGKWHKHNHSNKNDD